MIEPGQLIAVARDYQQITDVFRMMREHWGLTYKFCDDVLGFADGHTEKILGPSEQKRWGPATLHALMELFGLEFRVYLDVDAVKRMEAVWDKKSPRWFKDAKVGRISKKLVERAKPEIYRETARSGGLKRAASLPAKLRSRIARKGGKSRMRKATKAQRSVMMKKGWETRRARLAALAAAAATESGSICAVGNASPAAVAAIAAPDCAK